jgi:transposase
VDGSIDNAMHQHRHQHTHQADGYRRIEVITGHPRRRRWTVAEKTALVAESSRPGVNVSALARQCGVSPGLLHTWRRQARQDAALFVPVRLEETVDAAPEAPRRPTTVEIEGGGLCVRFTGAIDPATLRLVLVHLGRRA